MKINKYLLPIGLSFIFLCAWILQQQILLNWDASWLIHAARRLLVGGTYKNNFFETNPPLILYLSMPAILISNLTSLAIYTSFKLYIFALATISLLTIYPMFKVIYTNDELNLSALATLAMAAIFLLLPLYEFGQREHLYIIFTMPYLIALAYQWEDKKISSRYASWIGLLASFGFALKPHFLFVLAGLECIYMIKQRRFFAWWRAEVIVIIVLTIAYLASIAMFQPDYYLFIIPYVMRNYYAGVGISLHTLIFYPPAVFCWIPILFAVAWNSTLRYQSLTVVLISYLILNLLFVFILQHTLFYYHLLPAYSAAILLLLLLYFYQADNLRRNINNSPLITIATLLLCVQLFGLIIYRTDMVWTIDLYSSYYISLFAIVLLAIILSLLGNKLSVKRVLYMTVIGAALFLYPYYIWINIYDNTQVYKQIVTPLIDYLKTKASNQPVYYLTTATVYTFPIADYAKVDPVSRFNFFWMLPALLTKTDEDKHFFIHAITTELDTYKPYLVLVDATSEKNYLYNRQFDYIPYLSEDNAFQKTWNHYAYVETIEQKAVRRNGAHYRFDVYVRTH